MLELKRVAITGSTGLVGTALVDYLHAKGYAVTRIIRPGTRLFSNEPIVHWDIDQGKIDLQALEGHDIIIHLAGVNIAGKRWTSSYKEEIRSSRVNGTTLLSEAIHNLKQPPKIFFCASAVGFYGQGPEDKPFSESSSKGHDFLADVCDIWEKATKPAEKIGVHVVFLRLGPVISPKGGALTKMLPIFQKGLGGVLGNGRQMFSWVALEEIPMIVDYLINRPQGIPVGPYNVVSPNAVTNREFTEMLGRALQKPVKFPVPGFAARLAFGEMADAMLLGGANVLPRRLMEDGYTFRYPDLEVVLKAQLQKTS